jgi:hypothetical protein
MFTALIGACCASIAASLFLLLLTGNSSTPQAGGSIIDGGAGGSMYVPSRAVTPLANYDLSLTSQIAVSQIYLNEVDASFATLKFPIKTSSIPQLAVGVGNLSDAISRTHAAKMNGKFILDAQELAVVCEKSVELYSTLSEKLENPVPPERDVLTPDAPNAASEALSEYGKQLQGCAAAARFYNSLASAQASMKMVRNENTDLAAFATWRQNFSKAAELEGRVQQGYQTLNQLSGEYNNRLQQNFNSEAEKANSKRKWWALLTKFFVGFCAIFGGAIGFLYKGFEKIAEMPRDYYLRKMIFKKFPELQSIVEKEESRANAQPWPLDELPDRWPSGIAPHNHLGL